MAVLDVTSARRTVLRALSPLPGNRKRESQLPANIFHPEFIAGLATNTQFFHPRGMPPSSTETIWDHTIKDFKIFYAILTCRPDMIGINELTFPPIGYSASHSQETLKTIVRRAHRALDLSELAADGSFFKVINVFMLYHDIAKRTPVLAQESTGDKIWETLLEAQYINRNGVLQPKYADFEIMAKAMEKEGTKPVLACALSKDDNVLGIISLREAAAVSRGNHEAAGAGFFRRSRVFFEASLSEREFAMAHWLIEYHGLTGKIEGCIDRPLPPPTYKQFMDDLFSLQLSRTARKRMLQTIFLFNIAEGLQSDIFSEGFFTDPMKLLRITHYYHTLAG